VKPYSRPKHLFRLRSLLLLATLTVLMLPLGSLYFFSLYQNELVRQTESELIAQSAVIAATFKQLVAIQSQGVPYGKLLNKNILIGHLSRSDNPYTPITATLDLSTTTIWSRREAAQAIYNTSDPLAQKIGLQLKDILSDTQKITLAGIRLLDWRGTVIAGRAEVGLSLAHITEVQKALAGQYYSAIRERISDEPPPPLASISRGTGIRVFTAYPITSNNYLYGVIYLSRTPKNLLKHLYENRLKVFYIASIILLTTLALVLFVAASIVRPIRQLIQQTQSVTHGKCSKIIPLENPVTNELALLSESFADMANTLSERSTYIRDFAAHVSHEFKTPITAMQGALELLQDHSTNMPIQTRQRFISNMLEDTERLKHLVSRLLELARIDAMTASPEQTDLLACLQHLIQRYQKQGLTIYLAESSNGNNPAVTIPQDLLETLLANLFNNSLQHAASTITLKMTQTTQQIILTLCDNGEGISISNKQRIFTPFFTTRREKGGTGLGLGIIRSILKLYQGNIELIEQNDNHQGTCFRITVLIAPLPQED
jgi:signal transduction histidine kinase